MQTHKPCMDCGKPFRVRPYLAVARCSKCVKWAVINRDIKRGAVSEKIDIKWIDCPYCSVSGLMNEKVLILHVNAIHPDKLVIIDRDYI